MSGREFKVDPKKQYLDRLARVSFARHYFDLAEFVLHLANKKIQVPLKCVAPSKPINLLMLIDQNWDLKEMLVSEVGEFIEKHHGDKAL